MQIIKIKKKFTFWWRTYRVSDFKTVVGELALSRPTVVLKLLNGEYLYIGAERIKEMRVIADKAAKGADNGAQVERGIQPESE